jgi:hypothetical protein
MGEYSIAEQIMGFPAGDDLTKIYELNDVCYYVTNVRETTPSDPLFPVMMADIHDDCDSCEGEPCTDCDPDGAGAAPSNAEGSGATNSDRTWCGNTFAFDWANTAAGFTSDANKCKWTYQSAAEAPYGGYWGIVEVIHVITTYNETDVCGGGTTSFTAGNWYIKYYIEDSTVPDPAGLASWEYEQTVGFSCNTVTGKLHGSHTFVSAPCTGTACVGTPTVTIAP